MKVTIDVDPDLYRAVKVEAARSGVAQDAEETAPTIDMPAVTG